MRLLLLLVFLFNFFNFNLKVFWWDIENLFKDVKKDYKYYNELQILYDKWIILPDSDWNFNPNSLVTRQEFIWVTQEVSCKKCIKPNTDIDFINKYNTSPFFDINIDNKYFYCIADAKENNFVLWYDISSKCSDWTYKVWERAFCPNNFINFEEALAITFRSSWIMSNFEANSIINDIKSWEFYPDISSDVKSFISPGYVYSFYPYFKKAKDYVLVWYDTNSNEKKSSFLNFDGNKLNPKQFLTREQLLNIAYITFQSSSCIESEQKNNLAISIEFLDKKCINNNDSCELSKLDDSSNIYDYKWIVWWVCNKWISDNNYIWSFLNLNTNEEFIFKWAYLDNFDFLSKCKTKNCNSFKLSLKVKDNCNNIWNSSLNINFSNNDWYKDYTQDKTLWLYIKWWELSWIAPLNVIFEGFIDWWNWNYTYEWDFWDGTKWENKLVSHVYEKAWIYKLSLKASDTNWKSSQVFTIIKVLDNSSSLQNKDLLVQDISSDVNNEIWLNAWAYPIFWKANLEVNFEAKASWWVDEYKYEWDFWDWNKWEWYKIKHIYDKSWVYIVKTIWIDKNGLKTNIDSAIIKVIDNSSSNIAWYIYADKIYWAGPLEVNFSWILSYFSQWNIAYNWDFWDGSQASWKNQKYIFKEEWSYEVSLVISDSLWNKSYNQIIIKLSSDINCVNDSDNDKINDCDDRCVLLSWDIKNLWCPILDNLFCSSSCSCSSWYICSDNNISTCSSKWICVFDVYSIYDNIDNCIDHSSKLGFFEANTICQTCPCNYSFDFLATLRSCDTIFPAITSLDSKEIYSKWELFYIK